MGLRGTIGTWLNSVTERWRRFWLWPVGVALAGTQFILASVAWNLAGQPASEVEPLLAQLQALQTSSQGMLTFTVAIATIYYARQSRMMVEVMTQTHLAEGEHELTSLVNDLVGSALECGARSAALAEVQKRGLRIWNRILPESPSQREFLQMCWRQWMGAMVESTRAFERLSHLQPDLLDRAQKVYSLVLSMGEAAPAGRVKIVVDASHQMRPAVDDLWAALPKPTSQEPVQMPRTV